MSIQSNFPAIRPSLNLDFANTKALDPRITFTRASTATFYDGRTVAKAEENLLLQSQAFDNSSWLKNNIAAAQNTLAAPDGTTTAETVTCSATNTSHSVYQLQSPIAGQSYAVSVFAKQGTSTFLQIATGVQDTYANFDLSAGTVGTSAGVTSATITASFDGWYRCAVVFTNTNATSINIAIPNSSSDTRLQSWAAAGTETVYIWGAQLEQRSSVTAYTPTTTQPITNYIPALQTAAAGVARFDHNPVTGESLGLLIEEQRVNGILRSQEFDNASWTKNNATVIANAVVAPDGTLTADKVVATTATGFHNLDQGGGAGEATQTFSVYAKKGEYNFCTIYLRGSGIRSTRTFNLTTGEITNPYNTNSTFISAQAINVGNGWWRLTLSATSASFNGVNVGPALDTTSGHTDSGQSFTGDGYSGIYIWGAQLEAGAFPTSYIKTEAAQVTRSADAASMTGTNFSSWYRTDEGTIYASWQKAAGSVNLPASIGGDVNSYLFGNSGTATSVRALVRIGGVTEAELLVSGLSDSNAYAVSYARNDAAMSVNGAAVVTDTSCSIPQNMSTLRIGATVFEVARRQHIRKIAYYPARLSNAQLQAITS